MTYTVFASSETRSATWQFASEEAARDCFESRKMLRLGYDFIALYWGSNTLARWVRT